MTMLKVHRLRPIRQRTRDAFAGALPEGCTAHSAGETRPLKSAGTLAATGPSSRTPRRASNRSSVHPPGLISFEAYAHFVFGCKARRRGLVGFLSPRYGGLWGVKAALDGSRRYT